MGVSNTKYKELGQEWTTYVMRYMGMLMSSNEIYYDKNLSLKKLLYFCFAF